MLIHVLSDGKPVSINMAQVETITADDEGRMVVHCASGRIIVCDVPYADFHRDMTQQRQSNILVPQ